jgi:poly-gamma-glutamate capsule biosynthesis protein CapA/YwtB (metallophosphatase superfamily)
MCEGIFPVDAGPTVCQTHPMRKKTNHRSFGNLAETSPQNAEKLHDTAKKLKRTAQRLEVEITQAVRDNQSEIARPFGWGVKHLLYM